MTNRKTENTWPELSPREAYEKHFGFEPLVKLPDSARYLLANERKRLKVGRNGISFRVGREAFTYKSADTGALIGSSVEVFFNRQSPDVLGVKHPETGEVFAVRRTTLVPAMDAEEETLAQAFAENAAHNGYKRALLSRCRPEILAAFPHSADLPAGARRWRDRRSRPPARRTRRGGESGRDQGTRTESTHSHRGQHRGHDRPRPNIPKNAPGQSNSASPRTLGEAKANGGALDTAKTYTLNESQSLGRAEIGRYWSAWKRAGIAQPGLNRHALTQRILGHNHKPQDFTRDEWRKMITALEKIATQTTTV